MADRSIDEEIKFLFERNVRVKIIGRTVHKGNQYITKYIKDNGLKRRHVLKKYIRYCARCGKEIKRSDVYKFCSRVCANKYHYEFFIKEWLAGNKDGIIKGFSSS